MYGNPKIPLLGGPNQTEMLESLHTPQTMVLPCPQRFVIFVLSKLPKEIARGNIFPKKNWSLFWEGLEPHLSIRDCNGSGKTQWISRSPRKDYQMSPTNKQCKIKWFKSHFDSFWLKEASVAPFFTPLKRMVQVTEIQEIILFYDII